MDKGEDDCGLACCGVVPRRNVSDLFDRGLRRKRQPPLAIAGHPVDDATNGLTAAFSLDLADEHVRAIRFSASTCITLIAYCELICELASGATLADTMRLTSADLVNTLPDVPPLKRNRATLAIAALRQALAQIHVPAITPFTGASDESCLHLCHTAP